MTQHQLVYQDSNPIEFEVIDEGPNSFTVAAAPVITASIWGVTVGLFRRTSKSFAHWKSSQTCDIVTAWRVAQILRRLVQLRNQGYGYDATIDGLVIAMGGSRHEGRLRERAKDLGMTVEEFVAELERLNKLWPSALELSYMWDRLPFKEQDKLPRSLREAIAAGYIEETSLLIAQIETAELRLRTIHNQRDREDELIAIGLDPEASLHRFLLDIGVANLAYTIGSGKIGEPSHFSFDDLDRVIMSKLIGSHGNRSNISLVYSAKDPDDQSVHYSHRSSGKTVYWISFGDHKHPQVMLGGDAIELISVRWDRVTERFVLTLRYVGLNDLEDSRDLHMSISDLRARIGAETGLDGPLPPGVKPKWLEKPTVRQTLRRLFGPDHRLP